MILMRVRRFDLFDKLGFIEMIGMRPDEGIGPYKVHTVGPRTLTGPPRTHKLGFSEMIETR